MKNRLLCGLIIFCLSAFGAAQQCTTSVVINVFDARTKDSLRGLRASDFAASSRGNALQVVQVRPVFHNRVLVLLDAGAAKTPDARQALLQNVMDNIKDAPPQMPVAFGFFAEHAVFTSRFFSDSLALETALNETAKQRDSLGSRSELVPALQQALARFGNHQPGDTILLISNGDGRVSRSQWNSLAREFARRGTRLQLLMNAPVVTQASAESFLSSFAVADHINPALARLANATGGVLMGFMNSDWYNVAASGYLLEVGEMQNTKVKNWSLRVRDDDDDLGVAPVLFYPRHLPACSVPLMASTKQHGES